MTRFAALMLAAACAACASVPDKNRRAQAESELLALHEEVMRAHRESDVEVLLAAEDDDYVISSGGAVVTPDKAARRDFLGAYLRASRFSTYRDVRPPLARVSEDGTMGWVVTQVEARGTQRNAEGAERPIEFTSSWVELYERREGRWRRVGNVSSFAPAR